MLAPLVPEAPPPVPSDLPCAPLPELPDKPELEPRERDCSLFVDSRDWAIDHSFLRIGNDPVVARPNDQVRWSNMVVPIEDATAC
jgi:hypothetical protein